MAEKSAFQVSTYANKEGKKTDTINRFRILGSIEDARKLADGDKELLAELRKQVKAAVGE